MKHEYNEYIVGYVVTNDDGRSCNFQFQKIFSNHPQPDYELTWGCEGEDTYKDFSEDELIEMSEYLDAQEDVKEVLEAYNVAIYENEDFANKISPIQEYEIFEASEKAQDI